MRSNDGDSMQLLRAGAAHVPRVKPRRARAFVWGLLAFVFAAPAAAQSALDQRFAEGFSLLRFEPAPAGDRFFSVNDASSSDVPEIVRAMLLGHYTLKPTIVRTDADSGERREIVSSQLYAHLDASVVPLPWLLLNLDAPFALIQEGEGPAAPDSPALGDLRLGARARLVGSEHAPFSFAPAVDVWLPTGSEDNLTGDGSFRVLPKLNVSGRAGPFIYAANVGYLFREYLDTGSLELGNSVNFGVGAGFLLVDDRLQIGAELNGGGFVASERDENFASRTSPLEALFGAKFRVSDVVIGGAVGPGLSDAPGTAPRVVFSVAYAPASKYVREEEAPKDFGSVDRDGDGIDDNGDACPDEAGLASDDPSINGCPAASVSDRDGDGIPDGDDACPDQKGEPSSEAGKNGCPVPDRDGDGIPDPFDACPDERGVRTTDNATNGCPTGPRDTDLDGIEDAKDACPREAMSTAPGSPKDGCPGNGPAEATFAGFRPNEDGSSTVFVQLTDAVKVEVVEKNGEYSYVLKGVTVSLKNNRNPLLASEFDANVARAQLLQDKGAVRLVVRLKSAVKPTHRVVRAGKGASLEVSIPPPPAPPLVPQPN
jgi:OOP family OmpA-OmpF porin